MPTQNYYRMTDQQAADAIRRTIRSALIGPGASVPEIEQRLKDELGITGVAMTFHPKPDENGKFHSVHTPMFMFMAHGPSGKTIS